MAGPTNAQLLEQLDEMTKRATGAEARVATLTTDLATANERADQEGKARQDAEAALDTAQGEVRDLSKSLTAYKGSATKARAAAELLKKELSPEARRIGAPKPAKSPEEAEERRELARLAIASGPTELVFSDGRREIRELAPLLVTGADAWRDAPGGMVLNAEIDLEPGDCQRQEMELRGIALLDEAGEVAGYCALPDMVRIFRNQHFRLPLNSIRF